jgi:hypothetical protein
MIKEFGGGKHVRVESPTTRFTTNLITKNAGATPNF